MAKKNEKKSHSLPLMFTDFDKLQPVVLSTIENEIRRLVTQNRLCEKSFLRFNAVKV